jgi:hypothetical protein
MMRSRLVVLTVIAAALLSVTAPASAQTAPSLGAAQSFAVLSGTASVTNTGPSSLSGDLGTSGVAGITGFPPGTMTGALHNGDSVAAQAQLDAITAATSALINLQGQACTASFGATIIGVGTLIPGVYCYTSTLGLTGTLTLDAQNNPGAVFIIKVGSSLTAGVGSIVQLINGAQPCNVFWAVTTDATVGVGATFVGNLLVGRDISANTGARLSGRALAGRAVTLDTNTVEATVCAGAGGSTVACVASTNDPTITTIPNQVIPPVPAAGSVSVGFTISGAIITDALIVSATSSDSTLVPASAMVITRGVGGARVLTIRGADGRSGITTITVTVTDPSVTNCVRATSTSFTLTIGAVAVPTLSQWAYVLLMVLLTGGGMLAVRRRAFAPARRAPLD